MKTKNMAMGTGNEGRNHFSRNCLIRG
jgi:hypothetical protein